MENIDYILQSQRMGKLQCAVFSLSFSLNAEMDDATLLPF